MTTGAPPPSSDSSRLVPAGRLATLPNDVGAARQVRRSVWEPRSGNAVANHTMPPAGFRARGYEGMADRRLFFGRVTGAFVGTTYEVIQWAAHKWGLPVNVVCAVAFVESGWHQNGKDTHGRPINGHGYGDFGDCPGAPGGYGSDGPASYGITQVKWCQMCGEGEPADGGWPWVELSTAYSLDFWGAVVRGCLEGKDEWLGDEYRPGDMWGSVGRWYAGAWHTPDAEWYIGQVQRALRGQPWLRWPG